MNKLENIKRMKWASITVMVIITLLILSSCKQAEEETNQEAEEQESQTTDNYFDDVLSGETEEQTGEQTGGEESNQEDADEEQSSNNEEEEEYEAPTCGDSICTYYETYSSCSEDCEELDETTLYDYPEFLSDVKIVVGDEASSTDVITATVISTYLVTKDIQVETVLASEAVEYPTSDFILIGSPCVNDAIAQLLHYDAETCGSVITEQNNAVIKLLVFESNEVLIITGYDEEDTKYASAMLTDESYNLNGAEEWINMESDGDITLYFSKN